MASSTFLSEDSYPLARFALPIPLQVALVSAFLVSVPVFLQAPLVRYAPWVSLVLTIPWLGMSLHFISAGSRWGSLLYGFTLTWLAGSLYWGWLRTDPLWHLPIEALGLPLAIWGLRRGFATIGQYFYLGSLLGTAVTDLYIHSVHLLPEWRQVMQAEAFELAGSAFFSALDKMQTPWGMVWALELSLLLLVVGLWSLHYGWKTQQLTWWAFSGAVLSTLLVDSLFWWGAMLLAHP
ncbi:MAG: DUF3120 domain-containing protein [Cyanobacteriota bacterium]|nr:DUF3120 domain-containing protein [Cyanobacteriota bacterium]